MPSCWAETIAYLEVLLGKANKCTDISKPLSLQPALHYALRTICRTEEDGTPLLRAAAMHGPLCPQEPTDTEMRFRDQVGWSVPETIHL